MGVQPVAESCASKDHRLIVSDQKSHLKFLIDSGACISVLPKYVIRNKKGIDFNCNFRLYAANGSVIKTYGTKTLTLDLKLRRPFTWTFVVCDVNQPILGVDFLNHHKLVVDINGRCLLDKVTDLTVRGTIVNHFVSAISTLRNDHPIYNILIKYPEILKPMSFKEAPKHSVYHSIDTTGPPIFCKPRPLAPERYRIAKEEFKSMLEAGICRPSKSAWASPLHLVPKKDGQFRPCGDYRALNAITIPDRYPIPRVQDFTYFLTGKTVFSKIDIKKAYHNVLINPDDICKTAITTPFGLYEFERLTFGLRNAAQTFQRFMTNTVLVGLDFLYCYADDILISSVDTTVHANHLEQVFQRLNEYGITINLEKCKFNAASVEFLGYQVSTAGVKPLESKVQAIVDYPKPQNVSQLRKFLGMVNFYRKHLPNAIDYLESLNKYIHKAKKNDKTVIQWTPDAEQAFLQCKNSLSNAVTLTFPVNNVPYALFADASNTSVGAVLQQYIENKWQPLGYFSRKLTDTQKNYSTYDRELLAIFLAVEHFKSMIEGHNLIIFTDHKPLTFAFSKLGKNNNKESQRRIRQLLFISEFTTDIRHVSGQDNVVADALSRINGIECASSVIDYEKLAHEQRKDVELKTLVNSSEHTFKKFITPGTSQKIYCEITSENARPYLTENFRKNAFYAIHNLSHPGIRTSRQMIKEKYWWPNMNRDIGLWAKTCIVCQKSKVGRHIMTNYGKYPVVDRFEHIHVDLIGPLPITTDDYRYCLTIMDRGTNWPEAYPLKDMTAETVAKKLYSEWICRFGCPVKLTSDQGRQFESKVFSALMSYLGVQKIRTTPYHPQSNGAVERWHRCVKASLTARLDGNKNWTHELPSVMLGLRAAIKSQTGISAAQMVYGRTLRLPGEFFIETSNNYDPDTIVQNIRDNIRQYKPVNIKSNHSKTFFVHPDIKECTHVFLRIDRIKKSLTCPYEGPYKVLERSEKVFKIQLDDKELSVSIDRLKPAYLLKENESVNNKNIGQKNVKITRSGRISKTPVRFL